jgi:hypothetical protein
MSSFYYRLREYRIKTFGLFQKEMDLRLHRGQSGISKLEAGKMKIDADDLAKIKEVYHIPLEHFIYLVLGKGALSYSAAGAV